MSSKQEEPSKSAVTDPLTYNVLIRRRARRPRREKSERELDGKMNEHGVPVYAPVTLKAKLRGSQTLTDPPDILPLHLSVEPKKFVINPERGTEIHIRSLSEFDHDLIVTCNSYLYELKGANGRFGMLTQMYYVLKQYEMIVLTIGLTEKENICPSKSMTLEPHFPDGYLEIYHYRCHSPSKTNSDADWGVIEGKGQLVHAQVHLHEQFGHWKDVLRTEFETEEVKKRRDDFYLKHHGNSQEIRDSENRYKKEITFDLRRTQMRIDEPYLDFTDSEMERQEKEVEKTHTAVENNKGSLPPGRRRNVFEPRRSRVPEKLTNNVKTSRKKKIAKEEEPKTEPGGAKKRKRILFWKK